MCKRSDLLLLSACLTDKKLARVKTAPVEREEALAEDAAGFRK